MGNRLFIPFILFLSLYGQIPKDQLFANCDSPSSFNENQTQVILDAYSYGKNDGFGYILAAIAWQESCAGEYLINFSDPSAGIFHAYIPLVIKQYTKLKDTGFNRNLVGKILTQDKNLALKIALEQLLFWNQKYSGDQQKIIKSYNKGTAWINNQSSNKLAQKYYDEITQKIQILKTHIPKILLNQEQKISIEKSDGKRYKDDFYLMPEP
ncbi:MULTISPECIES: hypothetical protein [unclassified Helicobacter]|uniref:hypothetical protein n=1 Tax=unclassified Helicobacter TaxID=2593540 RepID=UPI000CF10EE1|nr:MULTISPECIES: hypothetical protein [unclassified Helicobacter]